MEFAASVLLGELAKADATNAGFFGRRGRALAERAQWPEAVAAFARARQLDNQADRWHEQGLALLGAGDEAGYRELCNHMLDEFQETSDASTAEVVTWMMVLRPHLAKGDRQKRVLGLARQALTSDPESWSYLENLGAACLRSGDPAAALNHLGEASKQRAGEGPTISMQLFQAIAHQNRGDIDEAKKWLDKAVMRIEADSKKPAAEQPSWHERLTYQLLRREAEELINPKPNKTR